jgi:hypothetical protein
MQAHQMAVSHISSHRAFRDAINTGERGEIKKIYFSILPFLFISKNNDICQLLTVFGAHLFVTTASRHTCESQMSDWICLFKFIIHPVPK